LTLETQTQKIWAGSVSYVGVLHHLQRKRVISMQVTIKQVWLGLAILLITILLIAFVVFLAGGMPGVHLLADNGGPQAHLLL
jgi:hypothetical protein